MLRMPASGMTVLAAILDFGGDMRGRPFPLCLYAGVPTDRWPGPTSDRVLAAVRVVRDLTTLRHEVVRFFNAPGRFESVFEDRHVDLAGLDGHTTDDSWVQDASAVPLTEWFERAQPGERGTDVNEWLRFMAKSGDNIAALESEDFEAVLSFPLSGRLPWDVQAAGWVRWLEAHMDLARRYLSLIVTGDPDAGPGRLVVVARRDINEEDFLLLTPIWQTLTYVDDLSSCGPAGSAEQRAANAPSAAAGAAPATSWAGFVRRGTPVS
jgi:hypothetical protein